MKRSCWSYRKQTRLTWLMVCLLVLMQIQLLPNFSATQPQSTALNPDKTASQAQYASLPLAFEPNQGQVDGAASFLVHHGQATTYFDGGNTTTTVGDSRVTMSLDGADTPDFTGTDQLESRTNYFIGNDQSNWHSDVPNYKNLITKNVYPGVDLKYYGTNSQLEHDFIVSPGADYKQIAFHFDGQENLSLDADGNLVLKTGTSDMRLNAPTTYQQTANTKHTIPSHFELNDNTVTIALNTDYDHAQPLIIDPVLIYSTYLGGTGEEGPLGGEIVVNASSNVFVSGFTASTNFPTTSPFQGSNNGGGTYGYDAFITKFNTAGSGLVYSTYLGGTGDEIAYGLAVDASGNAFVSGSTDSTNFPTASPFQASNAGGTHDAFIAKLNATGSSLIYSTYLGGTGDDGAGPGLAVDTSGNVYASGSTTSTNFPTASPFQASNTGGSDSFVTKLNAAGSALVYSTYLGGSGGESGGGLAIDTSGNTFVSGYTDSTNFPTASPFQASNSGGFDAFVTKFNAAGSGLTYSTYLGGSGTENTFRGLAIDISGNAYITGSTDSTNFPTASPYQASYAGSTDAFVTKFNAAGSALVYSTYLGGSGYENQYFGSIDVNSNGNAYVAGDTMSSDFPTVSPFQGTLTGFLPDNFVTKFNTAGSGLSYSTYLGGSFTELNSSIVVDDIGDAYVSGVTQSNNFPTASPFQASRAGANDIFITKLSENTVVVTGQIAPTLSFAIGSVTCDLGIFSVTTTKSCTHTIAASTNAQSGYVISYIPTTTLKNGAYTIDAMASQTASVVGSEQFGMNLKANTATGSFTAANFGADPSGGIGTVMTGYQTADLFKFATGGANIAQATGASATTTYTASFINNIAVTTEAGTYSTPVTYNIIATY